MSHTVCQSAITVHSFHAHAVRQTGTNMKIKAWIQKHAKEILIGVIVSIITAGVMKDLGFTVLQKDELKDRK